MQIEQLKVTQVNLGNFKLDGGAMFGIVPKPLWEKKVTCDLQNRIPLALRCLLVEGPSFKCLIDSGMGSKWSAKEEEIFSLTDKQSFDASQITHVILTHLHFDHAGGMTFLNSQQELERTFPNAEVFLNAENLKTAENPNPRERLSYRSENWLAYKKSGQLKLLTNSICDELEVLPGLFVIRSDGHTAGQQVVLLGDASSPERILYCGDLVPTAAHLPLAWTMGYDIDPVQIMKERQILLERAVKNNWMLCFEHDAQVSLARLTRIQRKSGAFDFELAEDLSEKFGAST